MNLKPCIECGKDCEILPVQLGDLFTMSYIRVCSGECMFLQAYDFLREIGYHKQFRGSLYDKQNKEDKKECDAYVKMITDESLKQMREHFEACPKLLSTPAPNLVVEMFKTPSTIPCNSGQTVTFARPSLEDRIKWTKESLAKHQKRYNQTKKELLRLQREGKHVLE